jgi:putative redox protein
VRRLFTEQDVDRALADGRITVSIAGRPFQISRGFFEDLEAHCSPERIAALARPLLVVHGTADRVVAIDEGERIFAAARQPRWFAAVPDANHLFTHEHHARAAAGAVVAFLQTVLPPSSS